MTNNGKNAADFGIQFYAGMLMSEQPANAHFVIMSDDQDLDHVVNLLSKARSASAERLGNATCEQKLLKPTSSDEPAPKDPISPLVKMYCVASSYL